MKIDFSKIDENKFVNFNGGNGSVDLKKTEYKGVTVIKGRVKKGCSVGLHAHTIDSETIYILSGTAKSICDGEMEILRSGDVSICPKGYSHCLINDYDEELVFFAVIPKQ